MALDKQSCDFLVYHTKQKISLIKSILKVYIGIILVIPQGRRRSAMQ